MTDTQLYLTVGLPVIAILVSTLVNVAQFSALNARMTALESRVEARISSLESKFDILVGKVMEFDNRLTRLEERLSH